MTSCFIIVPNCCFKRNENKTKKKIKKQFYLIVLKSFICFEFALNNEWFKMKLCELRELFIFQCDMRIFPNGKCVY